MAINEHEFLQYLNQFNWWFLQNLQELNIKHSHAREWRGERTNIKGEYSVKETELIMIRRRSAQRSPCWSIISYYEATYTRNPPYPHIIQMKSPVWLQFRGGLDTDHVVTSFLLFFCGGYSLAARVIHLPCTRGPDWWVGCNRPLCTRAVLLAVRTSQ